MSGGIHDQRLIRALRAMNSELAASNRAVAAKTGLNDSDLAVLDALHRDGPQTPTALARRTRMGTTTMTSVLRRLVRDGWVERRPSETDLRSFTIHATSADRLAEIFLPANRKLTALVDGWPESRVNQLIEFLEDATTVIHESAGATSSVVSAPRVSAWPGALRKVPSTASPTARSVTFAPTASMTPAKSRATPLGKRADAPSSQRRG